VNSLSLDIDWLTSGNDSPEIRQTMGLLGLKVGNISLTRNADTWSQTIRDTVLVSAYPLAAWLASSRLMGDYLLYGNHGTSWLASTDLRTSRQKYQRAFAAEFLCPFRSLPHISPHLIHRTQPNYVLEWTGFSDLSHPWNCQHHLYCLEGRRSTALDSLGLFFPDGIVAGSHLYGD